MVRAFILMLSIVTLSCASDQGSSDYKPNKFSRKKLSEADKLIYISSTIYFISDFSQQDLIACSPLIDVLIKKNKTTNSRIKMCKKIYDKCLLQGTCLVQMNGQRTMLNYHKKTEGLVQFQIVNTDVCPYGLGDSSDGQKTYKVMCLDPFKSVAADLSKYPLGTVIYIADVVGLHLPNGEIHDGYFVVRDSGGDIDGFGRFDFFTGFVPTGKNNVFSNLGLGGEANFEYKVVTGSEAERVLNQTRFPGL